MNHSVAAAAFINSLWKRSELTVVDRVRTTGCFRMRRAVLKAKSMRGLSQAPSVAAEAASNNSYDTSP